VISVALDTSAYSDAKRGLPDAAAIIRRADVLGMPSVVLGELLAGFRGGKSERKNLEELEEFLCSPRVVLLPVDRQTAGWYAEVWGALRARGRPIPTNDLWIAALALQHGHRLFTRDTHFREIAGLLVVTTPSDLVA